MAGTGRREMGRRWIHVEGQRVQVQSGGIQRRLLHRLLRQHRLEKHHDESY